MSNRKSRPHIGAWLEVDDEEKTVGFRADSDWLKNTSDEEQKRELAVLSTLAAVCRRAGYAVFDIVKKAFARNE